MAFNFLRKTFLLNFFYYLKIITVIIEITNRKQCKCSKKNRSQKDKSGFISREARTVYIVGSKEDLKTVKKEETYTALIESNEEENFSNVTISDFNSTEERLEETYKMFIDIMNSKTTPEIVKSCYLISGYSKISIEVSNGCVDEATCYFQEIVPELVENYILDISEEGIYHFVSPTQLTSDPENEATGKLVKEPGKCIDRIQSGSTVLVGGETATVTMLARDVNNSAKPYVITVNHVYSKKQEYVLGIKNSSSFINNQDNPIHIGSTYYGAISSLHVTPPDRDQHKPTKGPTITQKPHPWLQPNRPQVDIAAIPLDDNLINSLFIEKQVKRGFTFEVFTGNNEDASGSKVEIFGSRSGTRKGSVYPFKQRHERVNGKMIMKQDYIAVISESLAEDHLFCRAGDSGALVIDDNASQDAKVYQAYGILFKVNYHFKDSLVPGFPERRLALFVRLDNCFNELKQKWDIDLQPYTQHLAEIHPHNLEQLCEALPTATVPLAEYTDRPTILFESNSSMGAISGYESGRYQSLISSCTSLNMIQSFDNANQIEKQETSEYNSYTDYHSDGSLDSTFL